MHNVDALNGSLHATQAASVNRAARPEPDRASQESDTAPTRTTDSVELSPTALDSSNRTSEISRIRDEINAGTYLTDDRIDGAVRALLDDLA